MIDLHGSFRLFLASKNSWGPKAPPFRLQGHPTFAGMFPPSPPEKHLHIPLKIDNWVRWMNILSKKKVKMSGGTFVHFFWGGGEGGGGYLAMFLHVPPNPGRSVKTLHLTFLRFGGTRRRTTRRFAATHLVAAVHFWNYFFIGNQKVCNNEIS